MANTTFVLGTTIPVGWLTDANNTIYNVFGDGTTALTVGTKGQILAANAAGNFGKQNPGTDGQMLVADSSQTRGILWSYPPQIAQGRLTLASGTPVTTTD